MRLFHYISNVTISFLLPTLIVKTVPSTKVFWIFGHFQPTSITRVTHLFLAFKRNLNSFENSIGGGEPSKFLNFNRSKEYESDFLIKSQETSSRSDSLTVYVQFK